MVAILKRTLLLPLSSRKMTLWAVKQIVRYVILETCVYEICNFYLTWSCRAGSAVFLCNLRMFGMF